MLLYIEKVIKMPLSDIVFHIYTCQPSLLGQRKLWTKFAPAGPHLRVFILNRGQPVIPNQRSARPALQSRDRDRDFIFLSLNFETETETLF